MNMNVEKIKKEFQSLSDDSVVYLDSASTTQKPRLVIDAVSAFYASGNANIARGSYQWASESEKKVADVRQKVAAFINAESDDVFFTSGATASQQLVATAWALENLRDGDEVLYSPDDHEAVIHPLITLQENLRRQGIGIKLVAYSLTRDGRIDMEDLQTKLTKQTRLMVITHVHNVFGYRIRLEDIRSQIPESVFISLDCAQSIGHVPVDVQELKADFISFSGHKMFAYPGIGVLWVSPRAQALMQHALIERGTLNIAGIISVGAALDFISKVGLESITEHLRSLSQYALAALKEIPDIEFLPGIAYCTEPIGYGIISFHIPGISATDAGFVLSEKGICVRTNQSCNPWSMETDAVRVSLQIYNGENDIDRLVAVLQTMVS